ncbi:MAG: glycosyltransferase family 87 protein [Chloroflexota bacterium]
MASQAFLQRANRLLTPQRISYAWIAGGAMWLGWLISIWLGPGKVDLARQVIGADYLQFYAAGQTLHQGQSAQLYDTAFQFELEQKIIGPELVNYHAFITPPFLAWLFVPFSWLPYLWSFVLWSLFGLLLLRLSLKGLGETDGRTFGLVMTWYPIFAAISFGQNSLLSLGILSLVYVLWRKGLLWQAGLVASLVLYKPQLALGIGLLWLLEWRRDWKALAGLTLGGATLAALCFLLLPDASLAYIQFARTVLPDLPSWESFPLWHLHTPRGFFRLLFPDTVPGFKWLADGLTILLTIFGIWTFYRLWKNLRTEYDILFGAAICLTLWITPHAMIYDWAILLIPAVLLWRRRPGLRRLLRPLFAFLWLAAFLSSALTAVQLRFLPLAVQISIPVLAYALWEIKRTLDTQALADP